MNSRRCRASLSTPGPPQPPSGAGSGTRPGVEEWGPCARVPRPRARLLCAPRERETRDPGPISWKGAGPEEESGWGGARGGVGGGAGPEEESGRGGARGGVGGGAGPARDSEPELGQPSRGEGGGDGRHGRWGHGARPWPRTPGVTRRAQRGPRQSRGPERRCRRPQPREHGQDLQPRGFQGERRRQRRAARDRGRRPLPPHPGAR